MPYKQHLTMNRYSNRYNSNKERVTPKALYPVIVIGNKYFVYINRLP